jgi:GNAT superfamily N-acetyltransferase
MSVCIKEYRITNLEEALESAESLSQNSICDIQNSSGVFIAVKGGRDIGYYDTRRGYIGPMKYLHDMSRSFMNPGLLFVYPESRGFGVGSTLLGERKKRALINGLALLVMPERPGEGLDDALRERLFPYSTDELKFFYLRHGFREFSSEEARHLTSLLNRYDPPVIKKLSALLDEGPWPNPIYGNSLREKALKIASYIPIVCALPPINKAISRRSISFSEWFAKKEFKNETSGHNYDYVMSNLVYNPAGLDIMQFSPYQPMKWINGN